MKARKTNSKTRIAGGVRPSGIFAKRKEATVGSKTLGKWEKHDAKLARINERLERDNPKRSKRLQKKLAKRAEAQA